MSAITTAALLIVGIVLLVLIGVGFAVSRLYRKVPQGKALVVSTMRSVTVSFTGKVVVPVIHKAEVMDISVKTITIDRAGKDGLICQDNIRADISVNFFLKVNGVAEDVIKVAQTIGCERASDPITLNELFNAKFSEALKTAGRQFDFVDLYTKRQEFRDGIVGIIGRDLDGYVLSDVAIDYLEQTPLAALDPNNILDSQGIKKITGLTATEHIATNEFRNEETKAITKKNVETREATLELERQQADAEARQQREIESIRAREEAETEVVRSQERLRAEQARLETDQQVKVQEENLAREVAVAAKNRERVVAVEAERVEKARQVEVVSREVETTAAQRALEQERTAIAELARDRVAVEKTVAEQEEAIATLRVVEDANRTKQSVVITAEAEAQAGFVNTIKAAEAASQAAEHTARERVTIATSEREAAELNAQAKIRLAEGTRAEHAAPGLAEAEVKAADAAAIERLGLAEVAVKEADANAVQKLGLAQAAVTREQGTSEGAATEARIKGEAAGLVEKAAAMRELEGVGQSHEEFRLRIEANTKVQLAEVQAQVDVARANAEAVAAGLEKANIDIVGGTDMFVDRMLGATARGKAIDAFVDGSDRTQKVLAPYLEGEENLVGDVTGALAGVGTDGVQNLTVSAFLGKVMQSSDPARAARLGKVLQSLQKEGVGDIPMRELLG